MVKPLAKKYRHILYVPRNHEYYKSSPREVARNLTKLTKAFPEVAILENDTVVIGDQRFIAGTMWFRHQNFHQALNRRGTASRGEDGVSPGGPDR